MRIILISLFAFLSAVPLRAQTVVDTIPGGAVGGPGWISFTFDGSFAYTDFVKKVYSNNRTDRGRVFVHEIFDTSDANTLTTYSFGDTIELYNPLRNLDVGLQGPPYLKMRFQFVRWAHSLSNVSLEYYSGYYSYDSTTPWEINHKSWDLTFANLPYTIDSGKYLHIKVGDEGMRTITGSYHYNGFDTRYGDIDRGASTDLKYLIHDSTAVNSFEAVLQINDFTLSALRSPAPTTQRLTLQPNGILGELPPSDHAQSVVLYDLLGRLRARVSLPIGATDFQFNGIPSGLYFLRTDTGTVKVAIGEY